MRKKSRMGCLCAALIGVLLLSAGVAGAGYLLGRDGSPGGEEQGSASVQESFRETLRRLREHGIPFAEVTIEESRLNGKFYYQLLKEGERRIYKEILQGLESGSREICLHSESSSQCNRIFEDVLNDWPELFWCDGSAVSTAYPERPDQVAYVKLEPHYSYEGEERASRETQIREAAEQILSRAPADASDYDKVKYVYETIINTVDYDLFSADNQNIYSALVNKKSVCAGYSRSMQYLLERMGVFCTYVTGTAEGAGDGPMDHAWNLVRCDGQYYYVDVTWGDPVFQQQEGQELDRAMTYDYLCCSDRELFRTHRPDRPDEMPACTSEDLNYYRGIGCYYENFDREQIRQALNRSVEKKEAVTTLKFGREEAYQEAYAALTGGLLQETASYLGQLYRLPEVWYSYEEDALLCKMTVYWDYGGS